MVPLKILTRGSGARLSAISAHRNWMQAGAGLPRVFSYLGKRVLPRRFRDTAAQALELPQHNSGACSDTNSLKRPHCNPTGLTSRQVRVLIASAFAC